MKDSFTAKWQMWFIVIITGVVLVLSILSVSSGFEPPWGLTILFYVIMAVFSQVLKGFSQEEKIEGLVKAARGPIRDELERNYCVAKQHPRSILGTNAWVSATSSGIVLSFSKEELEALIECYSAIEFYNHDTKKGLRSIDKKTRVMQFIVNGLDVLDVRNLNELDCTIKLQKWVGNGSEKKEHSSTPSNTSDPSMIHIFPRIWFAKKGYLCQKGKQIHWGQCYHKGNMTVHSEANETPLCKHIECGKRISEEIKWIDSKDPIPGVHID